MDPKILYEDADVVAIDKPAGVMVHADGVSKEETVADWFAKRYPDSDEVGETQRLKDGTEVTRPGIVHRLDVDTSGVLVLAKTQEAHAFLKDAFKNREVKKTYLAVTYGVPKEKKGVIDFPIGRSRKDFRLRSAQPKAKGMLRDAITKYEVIGADATQKHALIKVMPETGRTHQIRVHLKAIHYPIVGDPLYAPNHPAVLGLSRLALHAYSLDLPLPSGTRTTVTAPLPADFAASLQGFTGAEPFIASQSVS